MNPQSRAFAVSPGGTIIGPVIEVLIVKIIDQYGFEIAIPSPNDTERTSYVLISRGKSRFVDEVHIPNAALRSSEELLTELQKSGGGEPCLGQSNTGIHETDATDVSSHTSNKETCANSTPPSQVFSRKEPFLRTKESGRSSPPTLRMEELCQYRSPKWLQERCVITIEMNDNLTPQCIGTRKGQYC